jgi:hypothetical protein
MEEKINKLRLLPIEEFQKGYTYMYNSANEDEKEDIIRIFKKDANELISKIDLFIEEAKMMMKQEEMLELV